MISGVGVISAGGEISIVGVGGNHSTVGEAVGVIVGLTVGTGVGVTTGKQAARGKRRVKVQILFIIR